MSNFSDEVVDRIWRKGRTLDGWNSDEYRLDAAGAMMVKSHRGTDDNYDWEIDHVLPKDRMKELGIPEEDWDKEDNLIVRISQLETRLLGVAGVLDITNTKMNNSTSNLSLESNEIPVRQGDVVINV